MRSAFCVTLIYLAYRIEVGSLEQLLVLLHHVFQVVFERLSQRCEVVHGLVDDVTLGHSRLRLHSGKPASPDCTGPAGTGRLCPLP